MSRESPGYFLSIPVGVPIGQGTQHLRRRERRPRRKGEWSAWDAISPPPWLSIWASSSPSTAGRPISATARTSSSKPAARRYSWSRGFTRNGHLFSGEEADCRRGTPGDALRAANAKAQAEASRALITLAAPIQQQAQFRLKLRLLSGTIILYRTYVLLTSTQ